MARLLASSARQVADDGQPIFYGCVKPMPDGSLRIVVLVRGEPTGAGDDSEWAVFDVAGADPARVSQELEILANGGGRA